MQDDHICGITGQEQVWKRDGWYDRFDVPFDASDTGYGHEPDDVAKVKAGPDLLDGYHAAVHAMTLEYIDTITKDELARVVDERWDPPVTASVRLCSILGDCLAHLGQADYVRGLAERAGGEAQPESPGQSCASASGIGVSPLTSFELLPDGRGDVERSDEHRSHVSSRNRSSLHLLRRRDQTSRRIIRE